MPSVILPHGHLTSATSPMLVSGHGILMVNSGFPEGDVMSVLLARHPSVILKEELYNIKSGSHPLTWRQLGGDQTKFC